MQSFHIYNLTLLMATALSLRTLFGSVWFDGKASVVPSASFGHGKAPVVPTFSFDEFEERFQAGDVNDVDAVVGHDISIVDVKTLQVQVELRHDSPLLPHVWHSTSRGPPLI